MQSKDNFEFPNDLDQKMAIVIEPRNDSPLYKSKQIRT